MASWIDYIWPFGEKRRQRIAREREIEAAFKRQLAEAQRRHGDIQDIVDKLKKEQEERRSAEKARRKTFPSLPTLTASPQESGS